MDVKIEEKEVTVNAVHPLVLRDDAVILSVDCMQKRPEYDFSSNFEDGVTVVDVYLNPKGDNEDYALVRATMVSVLLDGEWHAVVEYGKWGPTIYLVRKQVRDPLWPVWEGEKGDEDGQ